MDAVEDIKGRLSIEDVVSQYLELKRSGRNFKALSPFSNEKTASLMVSPEKQIWHDFSSGKGGDMFSFVMEVEGVDFRAALEQLARQAGVDLDTYKNTKPGTGSKQKERLLSALELATKFYQLHLSKNKTVLEYVLNKRGYTKETATTFRLGYSPDSDDALVVFLKKKGYSVDELKKAGLATQRYRGMGDMFRGRLMVPLMDQTGNVVGFTARLLNDDKNAPKYINTPATALYDKSRHVFGLHLAKDQMRKDDFAVVVEGNLDVIASHQAGVLNVVATAGTALTEQHLKTIGRFTSDVRLAFDQDRAGLTATERAIPIASKVGVNLSMITVPDGKDPDELVKKSPEVWRDVVHKNQYAIDWIIDRYKSLVDISTAQGKRQFSDQVAPLIQAITDTVERSHYETEIAHMLGVHVDALHQKMTQAKAQVSSKKKIIKTKHVPKTNAELARAQNQFIALIYVLPSLRSFMYVVTPEMLPDERAGKLLNFLKANESFNVADTSTGVLLPELDEYGTILKLLYEEYYQTLDVVELRYEVSRLQLRLIETYVKNIKNKIAAAMQTANEEDMHRLLAAAKKMDVLLKTVKENVHAR